MSPTKEKEVLVMHFSLDQKIFHENIQNVQRAMASHTTLPILTGILITAKGNTITLTATDLEIGIESKTEGTIFEEGSIVIPGQYLSSIIRELPSEDVSFKIDEDFNVEINCSSSHFKIKGYDSEEFPALPEVKEGLVVSFEQSLFKKMIDEVKFAASNDENQPFLNGALLIIHKGGGLELAATNLYRLASRWISIPTFDDINEDLKKIIPLKTLHELSRLLQKEEEEKIVITIKENHILFSFSTLSINSRLKEGQFPNFKHVIPESFNCHCLINRQNLLNAVRRTSLIAKENFNTLNFSFRKGEVEIKTIASPIGLAREIVTGKFSGPEIEIAFTADYIVDVLRAIEQDLISISMVNEKSACIIRGFEDQHYTYLVMPMQV